MTLLTTPEKKKNSPSIINEGDQKPAAKVGARLQIKVPKKRPVIEDDDESVNDFDSVTKTSAGRASSYPTKTMVNEEDKKLVVAGSVDGEGDKKPAAKPSPKEPKWIPLTVEEKEARMRALGDDIVDITIPGQKNGLSNPRLNSPLPP